MAVLAGGRDPTTTFNAWSFLSPTGRNRYLPSPPTTKFLSSTEMTAPRLFSELPFEISKWERNRLSWLKPTWTSPLTEREIPSLARPGQCGSQDWLKWNANIFFLRAGHQQFSTALADGDTLNQKKYGLFQPSAGAGFRIQNVTIDYAFTNLANQNQPGLFTHVFSLRLNMVNDNQTKRKNSAYPKLCSMKRILLLLSMDVGWPGPMPRLYYNEWIDYSKTYYKLKLA